jgi:hypothetical protein
MPKDRKPSSLTQAKEACRELITDMERRMSAWTSSR